MNWGLRITLLYLGFVALILTLVITCYGNTPELESKDYYARELAFQKQIDAAENLNRLSQPLTYTLLDRAVQIVLPAELLASHPQGQISFVRPSDASKDKTVALQVDAQGVQTIDPGFLKGIYKMQISFSAGEKQYYKEAVIRFN